MPEHDVVADHAGIFGNHPRYTCKTCDETLVAQPYMTQIIWEEREEGFFQEHPTATITQLWK